MCVYVYVQDYKAFGDGNTPLCIYKVDPAKVRLDSTMVKRLTPVGRSNVRFMVAPMQ